MKQRKEVIRDIKAIKDLISYQEHTRDIITAHLGEECIVQFQEKLLHLIGILSDEAAKLPIGHYYTGEYYKKRPDYLINNENPIIFEKKEGALFMRSDLMSWLEEGEMGYTRSVYKSPDYSSPLRREDGEEFFSVPEKFVKDVPLWLLRENTIVENRSTLS